MSPVISSPACAQSPDYCFVRPGFYFHLEAQMFSSYLNTSAFCFRRESVNTARISAPANTGCVAGAALTPNPQQHTCELMVPLKWRDCCSSNHSCLTCGTLEVWAWSCQWMCRCVVHLRVNMYVLGQVLTLAMSVNRLNPGWLVYNWRLFLTIPPLTAPVPNTCELSGIQGWFHLLPAHPLI